MEAEWRVYLKEHAPELYEMMLAEVIWAAEWRDKKIADSANLLRRAEAKLKSLNSSLDLDRCECGDECCCGAIDLLQLLKDIKEAVE